MDRADRRALALSPDLRNNPLNPVSHPGTYEIDPKVPPFPEAQDHRNTTFPAQEKTVKRAPVKRLLLIAAYAKKFAARFPESGKARKGKEIESAFERVCIVTNGKAESNLISTCSREIVTRPFLTVRFAGEYGGRLRC